MAKVIKESTQTIHRDGSDYRMEDQPGREPREAENRATDTIEMSDEERFALYAQSTQSNLLPNLPHDDEWHYCWLTTNNPQDPIHRRLEVGYQRVKYADRPEFKGMRTEGGDQGLYVTVREMVLGRIKKSLYQKMMNFNHSQRPARQLATVTAANDVLENYMAAQSRIGLNMNNIDQEKLSEYITRPKNHSFSKDGGSISVSQQMQNRVQRGEKFHEFQE